jgi:methylmalonyl-CoA mutase C-terminal domain/subunit
MTLFPRILELLKAEGASEVVLFGGGTIPEEDVAALKAMGVEAIFTPGTSTDTIVAWVKERFGGATAAA